MLSYDERALLHWDTRERFGARGQIVDAGCYLGGSTLALAHGLAARDTWEDGGGEQTRVHSFDIFEVGDERERAYFLPDFPFARGPSPSLTLTLTALPLAAAAAAVSYYVVELPLLRLKEPRDRPTVAESTA